MDWGTRGKKSLLGNQREEISFIIFFRPFRAEDMEGLYKKVIRGYYPKTPTCYTTDLNNVIRALL